MVLPGPGAALCAGLPWVLTFVVGFAANDLDIVGLGGTPEPSNGYDDAAVALYRGALPVLLCGVALILLATVRSGTLLRCGNLEESRSGGQ